MLALLALALASVGCQLRLAADVVVEADGAGWVELAYAVDEELAELLEAAGVDLQEGLGDAATAASADGWELVEGEGGTAGARFRAEFDDPAEFERLMAAVHEGLGVDEGLLFRDLQLDVREGRAAFTGAAGVVLPEAVGAEGDGIAFDREDLDELISARGTDAVRYDLRLTLPDEPVEHDADVVEGRTLVWELPVGQLEGISARSEAPADPTIAIAAAAGLLAAALAAVGTAWLRRRRSLRRAA